MTPTKPPVAPLPEAEGRAVVLTEAESWLRTPFKEGAAVLGAGIDCGNLLMVSYKAAGIAMEMTPDAGISTDWFFHRATGQLLKPVSAHAHEVTVPKPGDCVLFFIGKDWAHAAIVARQGYPVVIQARWKACVQLADCTQGDMKKLKRIFYSPWNMPPAPSPTVHRVASPFGLHGFDAHATVVPV